MSSSLLAALAVVVFLAGFRSVNLAILLCANWMERSALMANAECGAQAALGGISPALVVPGCCLFNVPNYKQRVHRRRAASMKRAAAVIRCRESGDADIHTEDSLLAR
ncbi:hypothetical protein [Paraburkholderia sp. SOS3]|uniref:hypothetical protein n=1 Tax=Paraburkholderia sp. SOS3 TaxID=1926494 RepID=UPI0018DE12FD|nr:hypothetical protein [Paraburkholderia sp. SOS3]